MISKPQTGRVGAETGAGVSTETGLFTVTLLDVGMQPYGDAVLCRFGSISVLIDGAHPGDHRSVGDHPAIQDQLRALLPQREGASVVTLLVVSHAHQDHIGALPRLVQDGLLVAEWALVADPELGWGLPGRETAPEVSPAARRIAEALREEPQDLADATEETAFLEMTRTLDEAYREMLDTLSRNGTRVIRFRGSGDPALRPLARKLAQSGVTMKILGPSRQHVTACAEGISGGLEALSLAIESALEAEAASRDGLETGTPEAAADMERAVYHKYASFFVTEQDQAGGTEAAGPPRVSNFVNLQSSILLFEHRGRKLLFTGDNQLSDPQTGDPTVLQGMKALLTAIRRNAPYDFLKMSHHGSDNGISAELLERMGHPELLGICAGEKSRHHPNATTLDLLRTTLAERGIRWARTDHNGQTTITFDDGPPAVKVSYGQLNDASPPGRQAGVEAGLIPGAPAACPPDDDG